MSNTGNSPALPVLKSCKIQNFKGLKNCEIQDFSRINLIVGKNDSGKSTLMEALAQSLLALTHLQDFSNALTHKTNVFSSPREIWYKYDLTSEIQIILDFGSSKFRHIITFDPVKQLTNCSSEQYDTTTSSYKPISARASDA